MNGCTRQIQAITGHSCALVDVTHWQWLVGWPRTSFWMSRFLHCGLHWQSALITLEVVKKRVLRISDWFRPVPNFFFTTVVLFSIFSDISWYLWSQTSPLSKDSIFFTTLKVCIFQVTVLVQFLLQKGDMSWLTPVSFFLVFHRCGGDFCCFHFCVTEWCLKLLTPRTITCWDKGIVWGTLPLDTVFVCICFL